MVRRRLITDDDDDDLVETGCHVDPRVEEAYLAWTRTVPGTRASVIAMARYRALMEGCSAEPASDPIPRFAVSEMLPRQMMQYRLVYLDGLNRPWRLMIVKDVNNPKYGYYAQEHEARRAAKRLGIIV